jgi:hypothetical protein
MIVLTATQTRHLNTYTKWLHRAFNQMSDSFVTKSAQKTCLQDLNLAYEALDDLVKNEYLETTTLEQRQSVNFIESAESKMYWEIPMYPHQFKQKHADAILACYPYLTSIVDRMLALVAIRAEVVETPINAKLIKEVCPMTDRVEKTIAEFMAKAKADYAHGISLMEEFGHMNVYANVHSVVNQYGTRFNRAFYYMDGKLTKLNTIICVYEVMQRRRDAKKVA